MQEKVRSTNGQHTGIYGVRTQRLSHHWPSRGDIWVRACNVWFRSVAATERTRGCISANKGFPNQANVTKFSPLPQQNPSSSPGNPPQRKHQIIAESRWHASCQRFWRKSCIVSYINIKNHPGPYPLLSLDFAAAIHAPICCSQLLMTGFLRETQSLVCTAVVFLDLTKAFDNVDHESLLLLLQKCGIGGTVLSWIKNFLEDRRQRIVLPGAGVKSNWFRCNKGVPQGSVLGPLLFNVYVSDLEKLAKSGGASMPSFADDFTLYCAKKSPHEAGRVVSDTLGNAADALEMKGP